METRNLIFNHKNLPIIDGNYIIVNNTFISTNLAQTIVLKNIQKENGIYNILGIAKNFNAEEYPKIPTLTEKNEVLKISVEKFINIFNDLKPFSGKDEMRSVMMGIYFDSENNCICSTNAHILKTLEITEKIKDSFILPSYLDIKKFIELVKKTGTKELIFYSDKKTLLISGLNFDYYINLIEGNYPNFMAVIPEEKNKEIRINDELIKEVENYFNDLKKVEKNLNIFNIYIASDGVVKYFNKDIEIEKTFINKVQLIEKNNIINKKNISLLMPVIGIDGYIIGLNFNNLKTIKNNTLMIDEANRAIVFNNKGEIKPITKTNTNTNTTTNNNNAINPVSEIIEILPEAKKQNNNNNNNNNMEEMKKQLADQKALIEMLYKQINGEKLECTSTVENTFKEVVRVEEVKKLNIQLVEYSDRSFAVVGDTKEIKDKLKELSGHFNKFLSCGAGWIFSNKKRNDVEMFINSL